MSARGVRAMAGMLHAVAGMVVLAVAGVVLAAAPAAAEPPRFPTAETALDALLTALSEGSREAVGRVLDPADLPGLIGTDEAIAREALAGAAAAAGEAAALRPAGPGRATVLLGRIAAPMPIPLVQDARGWFFDTKAGIEEIIDRRIGRNELAAIEVLRAFGPAQAEFFARDRDGDRVHEYARRFISTAGTRDGLYWPNEPGEPPSPFGPLIAEQADYLEGRSAGEPYRGYLFRILTRQGPNAPGGAHDYIINDNMIAGFAALAWPAEHGETGIMTFKVGPEGVVYERDLGPDTATVAAAIDGFDPGPSWAETED